MSKLREARDKARAAYLAGEVMPDDEYPWASDKERESVIGVESAKVEQLRAELAAATAREAALREALQDAVAFLEKYREVNQDDDNWWYWHEEEPAQVIAKGRAALAADVPPVETHDIGAIYTYLEHRVEVLDEEIRDMQCDAGNWDGGSTLTCDHCQMIAERDNLKQLLADD